MTIFVLDKHSIPSLGRCCQQLRNRERLNGYTDGLLVIHYSFFAGQHMCLGKDFALIATQLVLATVAQRYRLALAPGCPVKPQLTLTMGPRGGLPMILQLR